MSLPAPTPAPTPAAYPALPRRLSDAAAARDCADKVCAQLLRQPASAAAARGRMDPLTVMALLYG